MRGHEQIIAMRRKGLRPDMVAIHLGADRLLSWRDWREAMPRNAQVEIADNEPLSGIDMRFTVGLFVMLTGDDEVRLESVYRACIECGAAGIFGSGERFYRRTE